MSKVERNLEIPKYDLAINTTDQGLIISQNGASYIANKWQLTDEVISIINLAHSAGLTCHWQKGHPSASKYKGASGYQSGIHHISFARSHDEKWVFVLGGEAKPPAVNIITFNKDFKQFLDNSGCEAEWEWAGGKNIFVQPKYLHKLLNLLTKEDLDAVHFARLEPNRWKSTVSRTGLNSEELVEKAILDKLKNNPENKHLKILIRPHYKKYIPDLIFQRTGKPIILELKLAVAGLPALQQIKSYMEFSPIKNEFSGLVGGIVARDFHPDLRAEIVKYKNLGLYRYDWNGEISLTHEGGADILKISEIII